MAENKVEIKVTADTAQAVGSLGAVEKSAKGASAGATELGSNAAGAAKGLAQVGQGGDAAATGLGKTRQGVISISEQLSVAKTQIGAFIAAQLGLSTIKQVGQIADDYKNLEARIKLAAGEGKAFQSAMDGVVAIAQRTNSNLETTGNLFAKITDAGKSAGLSTQAAISQSLRLTETINQAVQLSGASAGASSAAITQLIQGLQSGVLRGDEFNSVMEQAPRLSKAMADGLGVTTGELRKLAETGQLTADTVITALKSQSDTLKNEFATLPPTVGRALENLSTSWSVYIGEASKASGTSEAAAKAINALSNNLGKVAGYLIDAGQAVAGFTALNLARTFLGIGTAAAAAGVATAGSTTATIANTVAQQTNAAAVTQNAVAKQINVVATSEQAAATARSAGNTSILTQATYVNTAGTTTNTAAQVANALAVGKVAPAADAAAAGVGRFVAILSTIRVFSLIGIITNFKDIGTAIGEGAAKLMGYKDRTEELARAEKLQAEIAAENQAMRERGQALLKDAIDKQFQLSAAARTSIAEFDKLTKEGTSAAEAIAKIGKDFDLATVPGIKNATAVLDKLAADGKISATQFGKAWSDALKGADLAVFEVQARAAFAGSAREAERLAQVMEATLKEAVKRTGLEFDVLAGGMGKAARSAINDTDAIARGLDSLKKQGIDTGQALTASISKSINAADSKAAIDAVKAQIESLRKVLGDKITDGLLDQAKQKALELSDALDKAKPGINSLREAMAELGLKSREELQATAQKATQAYDTIKLAGQQEGESYVGWQARKTTAAQAMLERLIAANNGVATEAVKTRAAMEGLEVATDSAGKSTVRAMNDGTQATERLGNAAGGAANAVGGIGASAQASAADMEKLAEKIDKVNAKYNQSKADRAGKYDAPEGKSVTGSTREERLAGQQANDGTGAFALRAKQRAGTLSTDDLKTAEAVLAAAEYNKSIYEKNSSAYSLEGGRSIIEEYNSARALLEQIKALQTPNAKAQPAAPARQQASPQGSQTAPAPASQQPQTSTQTVLVKLDFGSGKTYDVNTSSANDAQTLISAFQQAKRAAGM